LSGTRTEFLRVWNGGAMSSRLDDGPHRAQSSIMNQDRVYQNDGNAPLIDLLGGNALQVLDVGCGAGDNAALIRSRSPSCRIFGVTHSAAEAELAKRHMTACSVWDIEGDIPAELAATRFDAIIFSHVLEHLRDPAAVLCKFSQLLDQRGTVLIAVPNILSWAMRWQFLRGDFEYRADGVLDETHLRFFTYKTADRFLLSRCPQLTLVSKQVTGSVPLWWLRRYLLPGKASHFLDTMGCRVWPNLFGGQILLKAVYD
jgi:2-polyprenyl-3-methyl-5-hydroxy-6-metoxy-1,4-benzoquinol methylase